MNAWRIHNPDADALLRECLMAFNLKPRFRIGEIDSYTLASKIEAYFATKTEREQSHAQS